MKGVHNTPIEGLWRWFFQTFGVNIKDIIRTGGYETGNYNPNNPVHMVGLRTVRITVTAVQFTVYTGQLSNFDGTVRDYGTGIRPYLRINYHSLKISLPKAINLCLSLP